jgi:hypothetical protein
VAAERRLIYPAASVDLFLAICQGLGVALAIGVGGPLTALFVAVMASLPAGIDPAGTDYAFAGEAPFITALFAANVLAFYLRRFDRGGPVLVLVAAAAGAIFFAASLAERGEAAVPGLLVGALIAGLVAQLAIGVLRGAERRAGAVGDSDRGRGRGEPAAAGALTLILAATGIAAAALALFVPPAAIPLAIALVVLAAARRRRAAEKYEGLRVLR